MMAIVRKYFFAIVACFILSGCFLGKSDEQKRAECAENCDTIKYIEHLSFWLQGFDSLDGDTVLLKEVLPGSANTLDTFYAYVERCTWCNGAPQFIANADGAFPLANEFLIEIKGQPAHRLSNMKMGPTDLHDMFGANYRCDLIYQELDGKAIEILTISKE